MATSSSDVIDAFLLRVELDRKFFHYRCIDEDEGLEVARFRAKNFLIEACGRMMLEAMPTVNLTPKTIVVTSNSNGYETETEDFGWDFDLTPGEIFLLASLMCEQYMARDFAHLKTLNVNFTGTELRVFDPSNARKTFLAMYESVKARNEYLIDLYKNSDRLTGRYTQIDFASADWDPGDIYET